MTSPEQILLKTLVTEKATAASSNKNQYTFKVSPDANRIQVAQAVEAAFPEVTVTKVNIINVRPKAKRDRVRRGRMGTKAGYKKALVTLAAGQTIDLV